MMFGDISIIFQIYMYICINVNKLIKYDINVNKVQYYLKKDNFYMNKNIVVYIRLIVNYLIYIVGFQY